MSTETNRRILLTPDEMATLDDGQGWYASGDTVWLGGDIEETGRAIWLDLCVNDETADNWIALHELPESIRTRLVNSTD